MLTNIHFKLYWFTCSFSINHTCFMNATKELKALPFTTRILTENIGNNKLESKYAVHFWALLPL